MVTVFIGLGGNLGDSAGLLRSALGDLAHLPDSQLSGVSRFVRSKPLGDLPQGDYVNAVARLETQLAPLELLDRLHHIEAAHGRERKQRWGARTLDLDILMYGDLHMTEARLTIPHVGIGARDFVLYPLRDLVTDDFEIPGLGAIGELIAHCPSRGLEWLE